MQIELNEALDKEKELNEIKSRFVSMASHEFRTPLSTVLSSASLVDKYTTTEDQEKRSRHVDKIKNSVKHLNNLLEDFLSMGKLDEGKIGTHFHEFNLEELIENTIEEMKGSLKKGQQISFNISGLFLIVSDKNLLRNILFNLISNAIKFSDESKTIFLTATAEDSCIRILIADEGIGISEEDQEHLFSSFFRGKNVVNIPGDRRDCILLKNILNFWTGASSLKAGWEWGPG